MDPLASLAAFFAFFIVFGAVYHALEAGWSLYEIHRLMMKGLE